jgi:hypothetical protein
VGVWDYNAGKKRLFYVNLELFTAFMFKFICQNYRTQVYLFRIVAIDLNITTYYYE